LTPGCTLANEGADLVDDAVVRILLNVMPPVVEHHGAVVFEQPLESLALSRLESLIVHAPEDERRPVGDRRQVRLPPRSRRCNGQR